jgi:phage terminase large subunit-like protein
MPMIATTDFASALLGALKGGSSEKFSDRQNEARKLIDTSPARHICLVGGARSGKTFLFGRAIVGRALKFKRSRHAILRLRSNAARASISLDTLPKVVEICFPGEKMEERRHDGYFEFQNGSQIWIGGLDDKERVEKILGNEYASIYFNEASQIPYSSVVIALTRLAQNIHGLPQKAYYDLNPSNTGHWTARLFGEGRDPVSMQPVSDSAAYVRMFLNPVDNKQNLSPEFIESLASLPERQRKRFYEGQYSDATENALFTYEQIEALRVDPSVIPEGKRQKVVVAVDPSGAASQDSDNDHVGIIVAAKGHDGHGYVLADLSVRDGPAAWARIAVDAYHRHKADAIIAEINFGGAMVEFTIKSCDPNVRVKTVTASRGKAQRASPVSMLYARGLVHHAGRFAALEDELCGFGEGGYLGEGSPDRADAAIWALTYLLLNRVAGEGLLAWYAMEAAKVEGRAPPPAPDVHTNPKPLWQTPAKPVEQLARFRVPDGISNLYTATGRTINVSVDRIVEVTPEEAAPLRLAGWQQVQVEPVA